MCENLRRNGLRAERDDSQQGCPAEATASASEARPPAAVGIKGSESSRGVEIRCRRLQWEEMDEALASALSADLVLGADITCVRSDCSAPHFHLLPEQSRAPQTLLIGAFLAATGACSYAPEAAAPLTRAIKLALAPRRASGSVALIARAVRNEETWSAFERVRACPFAIRSAAAGDFICQSTARQPLSSTTLGVSRAGGRRPGARSRRRDRRSPAIQHPVLRPCRRQLVPGEDQAPRAAALGSSSVSGALIGRGQRDVHCCRRVGPASRWRAGTGSLLLGGFPRFVQNWPVSAPPKRPPSTPQRRFGRGIDRCNSAAARSRAQQQQHCNERATPLCRLSCGITDHSSCCSAPLCSSKMEVPLLLAEESPPPPHQADDGKQPPSQWKNLLPPCAMKDDQYVLLDSSCGAAEKGDKQLDPPTGSEEEELSELDKERCVSWPKPQRRIIRVTFGSAAAVVVCRPAAGADRRVNRPPCAQPFVAPRASEHDRRGIMRHSGVRALNARTTFLFCALPPPLC